MSRKINTHGGGSKTNENGILFEQSTSLIDYLVNLGFIITNDDEVYYNDILLGYVTNQYRFSSIFLKDKNGIDYRNYNSKLWKPDDVFINELNKTVYIVEKKFQKNSGSVDEKLATFQFKRYEYKKLLDPIGYDIQYIYLLSSWFNHPRYKDYFDYMKLNNCPYYFDKLPLEAIGLQDFK